MRDVFRLLTAGLGCDSFGHNWCRVKCLIKCRLVVIVRVECRFANKGLCQRDNRQPAGTLT